jgi:hypothetical protein
MKKRREAIDLMSDVCVVMFHAHDEWRCTCVASGNMICGGRR